MYSHWISLYSLSISYRRISYRKNDLYLSVRQEDKPAVLNSRMVREAKSTLIILISGNRLTHKNLTKSMNKTRKLHSKRSIRTKFEIFSSKKTKVKKVPHRSNRVVEGHPSSPHEAPWPDSYREDRTTPGHTYLNIYKMTKKYKIENQ